MRLAGGGGGGIGSSIAVVVPVFAANNNSSVRRSLINREADVTVARVTISDHLFNCLSSKLIYVDSGYSFHLSDPAYVVCYPPNDGSY